MTSVAEIFLEGSIAWERGRSRDAIRLFRRAAILGDAGAQFNLAHFYYSGESVRRNLRKSLYWYKQAWRAGSDTAACSNIAQIYAESGKRRLAIAWWRKAISFGDGDAALELAKFFMANSNRAHPEVGELLLFASHSGRISRSGNREARKLMRDFAKRV